MEDKVDWGSVVEGEKMFSLVNNSYRRVSQLKGNQCCVAKWMFYLNEVMPPATDHVVTLPWTFFSLGRHDWLTKAETVYLHWSHSTDHKLNAICFDFNNIYLDGFHMIDAKLFHTSQILKLFLLFCEEQISEVAARVAWTRGMVREHQTCTALVSDEQFIRTQKNSFLKQSTKPLR